MQSAFTAKEVLAGDTPVFLFECALPDGALQRWSSLTIQWSGNQYDGRVLRHNLFEAQVASDTQVGGAPKLSFELANADSHFSEIEQQTGFKGASLIVRTLFVDTATREATTDAVVVFRGLMNPPDLISETTFRLSAMNRMSMQRSIVPEVRVQRLCPWRFPATSEQRAESVDGGPLKGRYSPFYRCGYSPDQAGGVGNLNGGVPFNDCSLTRSACVERGMFSTDASGQPTHRFGGLEYVPATILVRGAGQKNYELSAIQDNQARYNDPVALVYGTQWHAPDVVFSRNDGNLTRMEVLLGLGEIQGILTVLVDDIVIPEAINGRDMTATGWWTLISSGTRNGTPDPYFNDGDPYGSMAYLSVIVPNRINDGSSIPKVQVLMQGMKLDRFDTDGGDLGEAFSANPAWVLLDILRRTGYRLDEIDCASFGRAAAYCDEEITVTDPVSGPTMIPRFQCNFALKQQRSAGEIIRALRNSSRLYLVLNTAGLLEARIENTFALQQAALPAGSNAAEEFNGGWPAYEFDASSIARNSDGSANFRISSKGVQDTPNRLTVEFQDEFNQYQQDSFSVADGDDSDLCGQETAARWDAMGISNFSQASRMLLLGLNRGIEGNWFIEFETSVKALGLMPGDLITVTYQKENLIRTAFRILKITPGTGFRTAVILAQLHNDLWYGDDVTGIIGGRGWQSGHGPGLPAPLGGTAPDENGQLQLGIAEAEITVSDGAADLELTVSFTAPTAQTGKLSAPLIDLSATVNSTGGSLPDNTTWFYAVSTVDADGGESPLSFIVQAAIGVSGNANEIVLSGIGLPGGANGFHVYRGTTPLQLFRIASNQTPAVSFTDTGLTPEATLPPDPQYDHANLYWRWELLPEAPVTEHSMTTAGNGALELSDDEFRLAIVRITRGQGAGQERQITSNSATTLTIAKPWTIEPDATSFLVVAENSWRSGTRGNSSPLKIDVPERIGSGIHVSARAANADGLEASYTLSPLTRWTLGQSGELAADAEVPPAPDFALFLSSTNAGSIELSGIAFTSLADTRSITAGTYRLHYFDELNGAPGSLSAAVTSGDLTIAFAGTVEAGTFVQIDQEIILMTDAGTVVRGMHSTIVTDHVVTATVYPLAEKVVIVPFIRNFFGTPASGHWTYNVPLSNARLASAELFMTNSLGDGAITANQFTATIDSGLRTLAGGQYSFQITGYLAVQTGAAPDFIVDADRSVRDVYAVLRGCATGADVTLTINLNSEVWTTLNFNPGDTTSTVVSGFGLPVLRAGDRLSLDVTGVGTVNPGSDLTVIVRI